MDPRDLEALGDADMAMADPNSDDDDDSYDEGVLSIHSDEGHNNESEALKALEEHAEHEKKFGHIKIKEVHEIDTSAALDKIAAKRGKPKVMHVEEATYAVEHLGEHLGEMFELHPWTCPQTRKASTYKYEHIYKHGEAKPGNVNMTKAADDLGVGVALYFQFVKSMATCLFFMTVLSAPALLFFFMGNRVPEEARDPFFMYMLTLGNLGYSDSNDSDDDDGDDVDSSPYVAMAMGGLDVSLEEAAGTLTALEYLQAIVLFSTLYYLNRQVRFWNDRREEQDRAEVTLGDFTVVVRDLPSDASVEELIDHFSGHYPLDRQDWKGRPPLYEAEPVKHADSTGQMETIGTWVAEVTIHRKIGHLLGGFRQKQQLMERLYRHRAEMKMYHLETPNAKGHNRKKYKRAEKSMLRVAKQIDKLTKRIAKQMKARNFKMRPKPKIRHKLRQDAYKVVPGDGDGEGEGVEAEGGVAKDKDGNVEPNKDKGNGGGDEEKKEEDAASTGGDSAAKPPVTATETGIDDSSSSSSSSSDSDSGSSSSDSESEDEGDGVQKEEPKTPKEQIEQCDAVAAFVVFNYSESMARCVEDYSMYDSMIYDNCYPEQLLFRGEHKIRIAKAPEPHEVNFENLEIPASKKLGNQIKTNCAIFGIFLLAFSILVSFATYERISVGTAPDVSLCKSAIPMLYNNGTSASSLALRRPSGDEFNEKLISDKMCDEVVSGSIAAWYAKSSTDPWGIAGNYSVEACAPPSGTTGMCPHFKQSIFCPCVSIEDMDESCLTYECKGSESNLSGDDDDDEPGISGCEKFSSGLIGNCYCAQLVKDVITGKVQFMDAEEDIRGMCAIFYAQYTVGQALKYVTIFAVTLANMLSRWLIPLLAKKEYHDSRDEEKTAVMTKTCLSMFLNLSLVALLAYIQLPVLNAMLPEPLKGWGVFGQGYGYKLFEPQWYGSIGSNLVIVFISEAFVTICEESYDYYVRKKCLRCCNYAAIESQNSHKVAMQHDLDMWEVGPYFDPTMNTAKLVALFFFTMCYSPGIPILMPLCFFTFLAYFRSNKYLLLRYYMIPDKMGDAVMKATLKVMPYATILRVTLALCMLSSPRILSEFPDDSDGDLQVVGGSGEEHTGYVLGAGSKSGIVTGHASTYLADYGRRLESPSVLALFVLLLLLIIYQFVRIFWRQLPIYWTMKIMQWLGHVLCGKPKAVFVDQFGSVRGYDLLMLEDELRQEMCPYTGGYYYLLKDKKAPPEPDGCCSKVEEPSLSEEEQKEGWQMTEMWDQYLARAKIFQKPVSINGVPRPLGDMKRTYEIICEKNLNSYRLEVHNSSSVLASVLSKFNSFDIAKI